MFKVLIGGRQTGSTTKIIEMIEEDIKNKTRVGIIGKQYNFDRMKRSINNTLVNKYLYHTTLNNYDKVEQLYILDILSISDYNLSIISNKFKEVWCDKPTPLPMFNKIEFDIAKEYKYKTIISTSDLIKLVDFGIDLKLVFQYMKSPLTRKDIEFIRYEKSFLNIERLEWMKNNTNYYCEFSGIMFK